MDFRRFTLWFCSGYVGLWHVPSGIGIIVRIHIEDTSPRMFPSGYLLQSAALQQAYKSTRVCRAIGSCLASDAIRNPPHAHGLSQAASPASGVRGLSGGVWVLKRTPLPLLRTALALRHLPGAGRECSVMRHFNQVLRFGGL